LLELIRAHGAMTQAEIEERGGENWRTMLAELNAERRIASINLNNEVPRRIIASEDRAIYAAAYPGAEIEGNAP
jgi:hypothetical protein